MTLSAAADRADVPGGGLALRELPYIQVLADDGTWAASGTAGLGGKNS
jgi:hypothetical protein